MLYVQGCHKHATKDGYTRAVGWSCKCTGLALLHVAAKLLLVLLNSAGLAAARRERWGRHSIWTSFTRLGLHHGQDTPGTKLGIAETAPNLNGRWNR
eukprot:1137241-Pelagomonas_calceolata.AAC.3